MLLNFWRNHECFSRILGCRFGARRRTASRRSKRYSTSWAQSSLKVFRGRRRSSQRNTSRPNPWWTSGGWRPRVGALLQGDPAFKIPACSKSSRSTITRGYIATFSNSAASFKAGPNTKFVPDDRVSLL
jgi:hypothetical protein